MQSAYYCNPNWPYSLLDCESQFCQHVDNVCAVLIVLADKVCHFLQVLRRQPVPPLQLAQNLLRLRHPDRATEHHSSFIQPFTEARLQYAD